MIKSLIQTGNSKALIISKEMREHLGIGREIEVEFKKNSIVLRRPGEDQEAKPSKKDKKALKKGK